MQAEQIAKTLGNAKKANGQWVASCPVPGHGKGNGDKNPSLSIHIGEDGKPLFHCHGGCSQEDVFNTIKDRRLLPELTEKPDPLANIRPIPKNIMEQEWLYLDEDRSPVFAKIRFRTEAGEKTYRLNRIDETGRRYPSIAGARIVPYNLPGLLDAKTAGRNLYLVEGEKAADALMQSIGGIATTSHTGANAWPQEITEYFAGANVVVLPDNDLSGWGYARHAATAILPIVKSLKVVDLGLQGKGDDVVEFIEEGGGRAELAALVKAAPIITSIDEITIPERLNPIANSIKNAEQLQRVAEIEQEFVEEAKSAKPANQVASTETPPPTIKHINIEHWDSIQDEPVKWLIEGVLPEGAFSAIYGAPGSFKSFHALHIALCVATKRDWMGQPVNEAGAVLYICGEGFGGIGARIKAIKQHHKTPTGAPIYVIRHQLNLRSSAEDFNALIEAIENLVQQTGITFKLVIVDTLARSFGGGDENSAADMMQFVVTCGLIQQVVQRAALMVLHHSGKDTSRGMRGSSSLLGAVDTEIELLRIEDSNKGFVRIAKQKDGESGTRYGFEMVSVELESPTNILDIGEPATSLVVESCELGQFDAAKRDSKGNAGHGKNQVQSLQALESAIKKHGLLKLIEGSQRMVVDLRHWRAELWSKMGCSDEDKDSFKVAWGRVRKDLAKYGHGQISDGFAWLTPNQGNGNEF